MYEKEQKEMGNCTFAPKLNKKTKIRKPEASILVQNYYTTVVSARRGKRPTLINKDLLTQELMKQEKDKRDAERKAKSLKKNTSKSKDKNKSKTRGKDESKSVSDFNDDDDEEDDEVKKDNVTSVLGTRLKVAFANKEPPKKKKKKVKKTEKKEDDHCRGHEDESKLLVR
jgi:hypothetical protein